MGGANSGRRGGRPTVENCLQLDLPKLMDKGVIVPDAVLDGNLTWSAPSNGKLLASVGYQSDIAGHRGTLSLRYNVTIPATGQLRTVDLEIALIATEQPFGGIRWWFLCPSNGARVTKVYLPHGAASFASRQAHRLGYRSQRQTPQDRAISRAFKLRSGLKGKGGIGTPILRPQGMHHATFDRKLERVRAAEATCDGFLERFVHKVRSR